ncbi:hypothetical protein VTO42DRAFT_3292 [Malbranchea cinnamomea]
MASTPKETISVLDSFTSLGDDVYLRDPPKDGLGSATQPCATIVLLFWMGASKRNAAKYLAEYIKLAPQARIIFILTSPQHIFLSASDRLRQARVVPAVEALLSSASANRPMLFHFFSNGGGFTLRHLATVYQRRTGRALPMKALLIDSAPGIPSVAVTHKALSYSFPKFFLFRILVSVIVRVALELLRVFAVLTRRRNPAHELRKALNDPSLISLRSKRCYLYSEGDELIPWQTVETHAVEAKEKGWEVTFEKFPSNSAHVMHMRTDPERYWKIVTKYLTEVLQEEQ